MEVAGGDIVAGGCGCAQNPEIVGSSGARPAQSSRIFASGSLEPGPSRRGAGAGWFRGRCACRIRLLRRWRRPEDVHRCGGLDKRREIG